MGEVKGFLKHKREEVGHRPVEERIKDFNEMDLPLSPDAIKSQAARCMDCGIPFCHGAGCPLDNNIPEMNDLVYQGQWEKASAVLHETNNFPEITGRICPAPCEAACTLAVSDEPVLIRHIELQIVERAFKEGWLTPANLPEKTGKRVAVIGSGPAGLAAAQQLARAGHEVVVFEKDEKAGGLLRYGIPDFKLDKAIIDRRLNQMMEEGVRFETGVEAGSDISVHYLKKMFDAIFLSIGAGKPRNLAVQGRNLKNIMFAMDYLGTQNRLVSGEYVDPRTIVNAKGLNVIVIGGGDTGSDCVGTARRQGAKSITQLEILPQPPETRRPDNPWPYWPTIMRTSSSQEEGCERRWSIRTKNFSGKEGKVAKLHGCEVQWSKEDGRWKMSEKPSSDFVLDADLVLLALGFVHAVHEGFVNEAGLKLDERGNVMVKDYQTSSPSVFAAGDTVSGASLVVRAIRGGREAAAAIDRWLRNENR